MGAALLGPCSALLFLVVCLLSGSAGASDLLDDNDAHLLESVLLPASRATLDGWMERHEQYVTEAMAAREGEGFEVLVYGDSITESFRGESMGRIRETYNGNKSAWRKLMLAKHSAAIFSIAGDQTMHVLWRLQNGEGPHGLNPRAVFILIGTNDVAHQGTVHPDESARAGHVIALAVRQIVGEVRAQAPSAEVYVVAVPPLQPRFLGVPQLLYQSVVDATNAELQGWVDREAQAGLHFVDCGPPFLLPDGSVDFELMSDGVHPHGRGGALLLECMLGAMEGGGEGEGAEDLGMGPEEDEGYE